MLNLDEKIKGCLIGCAAGIELGYATTALPARCVSPDDLENVDLHLDPHAVDKADSAGAIWARNYHPRLTPFVAAGVRAYLQQGGRIAPEDWAAVVKNDSALATPTRCWDGIHTIQELLMEGMNPRLSGLGNAPAGLTAAFMPAAGIYHFANPEQAYLDGVEIASVTQPRLGADWAALCAAALAAALDRETNGEAVVDAVMAIARMNNPELYYQLNDPLKMSIYHAGGEDRKQFLAWWHGYMLHGNSDRDFRWTYPNPIFALLPLLRNFGDEPLLVLKLLRGVGANPVAMLMACALLGAIHGAAALPREWVEWAEPAAAEWFGITAVVKRRQAQEKAIVSVMGTMGQAENNMEQPLFDRIYGCLLASSIGNAMGSPVEGRMYEEIDRQFPNHITTILEPSRLESEDDNQMAMLLLETYLGREGRAVAARHFGKTWYDRLDRDHFYVHCMGNAYDLIRAGWDARITGHWSVVTGSTVMCMEPVGIYHIADPASAYEDAVAVSYMYQRGLDVTAAGILAAATAEALRAGADVNSVCDTALRFAPTTRLRTFDERPFESVRQYLETCLDIAARHTDVLQVREQLYAKCLLYDMIDPLEVIGFALAMFVTAGGDVRQAAIGGTNIGRDSDTIAGRAAMLSGALRGTQNIPAEWVDMFSRNSLQRIRDNAQKMANLLLQVKLPLYTKRIQS